ncbi:MAG: HNH endonuclease, partial [Bacteroidaceae bacterium]|nr:HNH endonuclease [Bacteroidaceae bacterium]
MIDQYNETRECDYKGEHYSVRDNGAVMRHARVGKRIRKYDNLWTLGNPNKHNGYLLLVDNPIHRIVATAFHGNCPGKNYVVDHIDTNRRNNRPENLRWVTRLENILNNE